VASAPSVRRTGDNSDASILGVIRLRSPIETTSCSSSKASAFSIQARSPFRSTAASVGNSRSAVRGFVPAFAGSPSSPSGRYEPRRLARVPAIRVRSPRMRSACVVAPVAKGQVRSTDLSVAVFTTSATSGPSIGRQSGRSRMRVRTVLAAETSATRSTRTPLRSCPQRLEVLRELVNVFAATKQTFEWLKVLGDE
jgi:hypothetical protein